MISELVNTQFSFQLQKCKCSFRAGHECSTAGQRTPRQGVRQIIQSLVHHHRRCLGSSRWGMTSLWGRLSPSRQREYPPCLCGGVQTERTSYLRLINFSIVVRRDQLLVLRWGVTVAVGWSIPYSVLPCIALILSSAQTSWGWKSVFCVWLMIWGDIGGRPLSWSSNMDLWFSSKDLMCVY